MIYSRRSILRDAALLSLAGVASASPLSLVAQTKKPKPKPRQPRTPPSCNSFSTSGVRIFFAGSWLFLADPTSKTPSMWAVARDMTAIPHNFPYGVWQEPGGIDHNKTTLQTPATGQQAVPYVVNVSSYSTSHTSVTELFDATILTAPFTYLTNADKDILFNARAKNLIIVSVPIPTQILPAAFLSGASVTAGTNVPLANNPKLTFKGIATTHIFEYQGPQAALAFTPPNASPINLTAGLDFNSDMHFHTVPKDGMDHSVMMFVNLLNTIQSQSSAFGSGDLQIAPAAQVKFDPGPLVSKCLSTDEKDELEIPAQFTKSTLASCAGGGMALGGDCC
jgi:hypothetical protein